MFIKSPFHPKYPEPAQPATENIFTVRESL